jgi:hypothetical protein
MALSDLPPPSDREIDEASNRSWLMAAALIAVVGIIVLGTCGRGIYRDYQIARSAADRFHQRLDRAGYESIYNETTATFRSSGSHDDAIRFLKNVHEKMGNSGAMIAAGFHINWQNGDMLVDEVFQTHFAQGSAQEGFIWLIDNGEPLLQTYRVDAPQIH